MLNANCIDTNLNTGLDILKRYGYNVEKYRLTWQYAPETEGFILKKSKDSAEIVFSQTASFYNALLHLLSQPNSAEREIRSTPKADLCYMADCSRNGVLTVEAVKRLAVNLALMGFSRLMLYTEDTYQLPDEPYFGHLRGRYTAEEIREVDSFCHLLGIELIPCIQTLAHLNAIFKWDVYGEINDTGDILMPDSEATYALVEKMIKFCADNFKSCKIMLGMDEAWMLGRGRYHTLKGCKSPWEIMRRHLEKITGIASKYGLFGAVWSDMFFRVAFDKYYISDAGEDIPKEVAAAVPGGLKLYYWDYYSEEESTYDNMFRLHFQLAEREKIGFAGGAWKWMGFVPNFKKAHSVITKSMASAMQNGISDIILTGWSDNGAECSVFANTAMLLYASCLNSRIDISGGCVNRLCKALTGYTYAEWETLELLNPGSLQSSEVTNENKYIFYNDLLTGQFDQYIKEDMPKVFDAARSQLFKLAARKTAYSYIFKTACALARVLKIKCEIALKLRAAYLAGDADGIGESVQSIRKLIPAYKRFYSDFKFQWEAENKPFGFDVMDFRIGGLIQRAANVISLIERHLKTDCGLPELEQERLKFYALQDDFICANYWQHIATVNII